MAVGTGQGGDANRRQQVARCPVAQAGLGDADGSLVTLVVDRHDTALACNLALRPARPMPEDRLLAMHRITVLYTQLRHRDSEPRSAEPDLGHDGSVTIRYRRLLSQ